MYYQILIKDAFQEPVPASACFLSFRPSSPQPTSTPPRPRWAQCPALTLLLIQALGNGGGREFQVNGTYCTSFWQGCGPMGSSGERPQEVWVCVDLSTLAWLHPELA